MFKRYFLLTIYLVTSFAQAGVVVLCDLPGQFKSIIKKEQDQLNARLESLNQKTGLSYVFESATFAPHLSLAFVSSDKLSLTQICAQHPDLIEDLALIAKQADTIDISCSLSQAKIDYWQGKFMVNCAGSKKQNYVNVVLKLGEQPALVNLANQIQDLLKNKYGIEQSFSFSAHITLGRICDQHDQVFETKNIAAYISKFKHKINLKKSLQINNFKLKGHDGSQQLFMLKK